MTEAAARIGPNAIIQLGETFAARDNSAKAKVIYAAAGCLPLLSHPPERMVDESIVARLFTTVASDMPEARDYLKEAGTRTGDYILANRIPAFARRLLPLLPSRLALKILLRAIQKHSWTFAGSGTFHGASDHVSIKNNKIATRLGCVWHEAVFTRIFSRLLRAPVEVRESTCCGRGADTCRFEIHFKD